VIRIKIFIVLTHVIFKLLSKECLFIIYYFKENKIFHSQIKFLMRVHLFSTSEHYYRVIRINIFIVLTLVIFKLLSKECL